MAFQQQFHHHANHVEYNTLNAFHSPPLWNNNRGYCTSAYIVNGNEPKWALAIRTLNSINRKLSLSAIATAARCTHGVSVRRLTHIPGHSHACASRDDRSAMCVWNSYLKGVRSTAAALWMRAALTMRALWPPWMRISPRAASPGQEMFVLAKCNDDLSPFVCVKRTQEMCGVVFSSFGEVFGCICSNMKLLVIFTLLLEWNKLCVT